MYKQFLLFIALILVFFFYSCRTSKLVTTNKLQQPKAEREFRAAWVATVDNINWPSRRGISVDSQKREAIMMLDFLKAHNFNAVIFQVRPQADAMYKSELEPWSYYLTGKQGKAPEPFYDPLQFWIEEAHNRGLELHVWLNPYRSHYKNGGPVTENSIVKKKPELNVFLKDGYWWFDPSLKGTKEHCIAVVMDIVKRYDIDGVHFDDYFYPYPEYNKDEDFPDSASYAAYQAGGGTLSKGDWRRNAVNDLIETVYKKIKKEKKWVKFGVSPFGIWRDGYPEGICCFSQYDILYADAKLWLNKGWIDYFSPQLYWPIARTRTSFPLLLGWWKDENIKGRHLWPGINVGDTGTSNVTEVVNQVMIDCGMTPKDKGVIHWSIGEVMRNQDLQNALISGPYKNGALVPPSPWLDNKAPEMPATVNMKKFNDTIVLINWTHADEKDVFRWVVYYCYGNTNNYKIMNRNDRSVLLPESVVAKNNKRMEISNVAVSAVDRTGNESEERKAN